MDFVSPISDAIPENVTASELHEMLSGPRLAWNTVVLDRSAKRAIGSLPEIFHAHLDKLSPDDLAMTKPMLEFWVDRKDRHFAVHDWPLEVAVYKNAQQELIVQAKVLEPKTFTPNLPKEWRKKRPAPDATVSKR